MERSIKLPNFMWDLEEGGTRNKMKTDSGSVDVIDDDDEVMKKLRSSTHNGYLTYFTLAKSKGQISIEHKSTFLGF